MSKYTDEQAADATIEVLGDDFEVSVLRSWFKPDPGQREAGPSEWVARRDHAKGMLQVGRALLALRAQLAEAEAKIERVNACCPEDVGPEEFIGVLLSQRNRAEARLARLRPVVEDLEDYFAERADADCVGDPPRYVGNEAMTFLTRIRMALGSEQEGRNDG